MRNTTLIWDTEDRIAMVNADGELTVHDADLLTQLQTINPLGTTFDTIVVTFTDATKATIFKVEYKLSGVVVKTFTVTSATLTDTIVKT
jgi:hypothetical protein